MTLEIKQLVIKSSIANTAKTNKPDSSEAERTNSNAHPECDQWELRELIQQVCQSVLSKELRKQKER